MVHTSLLMSPKLMENRLLTRKDNMLPFLLALS